MLAGDRLFTAEPPIEQSEPEPEKIGVAKLLFGFTGLYERWRNEIETRRHPDDLADRLRKVEEWQAGYSDEPRNVNWGNQGSPDGRSPRAQVWDIAIKIGIWFLTGAVGFAYGRLWDHEHRISVLEGREVPRAGSP